MIDGASALQIARHVGKIGVWRWHMVDDTIDFDEQGQEIFLLTNDDLPLDYVAWFKLIHPEDRLRASADLRAAIATNTRYEGTFRILRKNGTSGYIHEMAEVRLDDQGRAVELIGVVQDVTTQAELDMAQRHSQKMDVVGKIAGGVAHDFNNILAVIIGNLELLSIRSAELDKNEFLDAAMSAARRGAALTHKLLAYSRKQPLAPKAIDTTGLLGKLKVLLQRILGGKIDLELSTEHDLWWCIADANQLETVLINLAINARDAMPSGGRLCIEAFNLEIGGCAAGSDTGLTTGQYVCFALTDNGIGMDPETVKRATDPFFTTKAVGSASGLGLSMAHGFAEQSKGQIKIASTPGHGTSVKLYLPRAPIQQAVQEDKPVTDIHGAGLKVLVVEDDPKVRQMVTGYLKTLGCQATEAADGKAAMGLCDQAADYDVLLLDMVLPGGTNGWTLSKALTALCPQAATVFMSGYTENAIFHNGCLADDALLLQKPFSRDCLAEILGRAMGRRLPAETPTASPV